MEKSPSGEGLLENTRRSTGVNLNEIQFEIPDESKNNISSRIKRSKAEPVNENLIHLKKTSNNVCLQFREISCRRGNTLVLNEISGEIKPAQLTGVIGPSGSGKTTLIKVLSHQLNFQKGEVLLNRVPLAECIDNMKWIFGFVPQEDILHPLMTPTELITLNAKLRLDKSISDDEIARRVEAVISSMGIEKIKDRVVGSIERSNVSGGQRKRVSIAMELIADPAFLFLDEPTSGLDSYTAKQLMLLLHSLTKNGITILTVLHQPNFQIFMMIDQIMVMGKKAQICYNGPTKEALGYFHKMGYTLPRNTNPVDFFIDVACGSVRSTQANTSVLDLRKHASERALTAISKNPLRSRIIKKSGSLPNFVSDFTEQSETEVIVPKIGNFFHQFLTLLYFAFIANIVRAAKRVAGTSLVILLVGIAFGLVFKSNENSVTIITIHCLSVLAYGMIVTQYGISLHATERDYFRRLCFNDVWKISYLMALNMSQILVFLIWPLLWLCVYYPVIGFTGGFGTYYFIFVILTIVHILMGVTWSTFLQENARICGVCVGLLFTIISGATPKLAELEVSVIGSIVTTFSLYRHAQEIMFSKEYPSFNPYWKHIIDEFKSGYTIKHYDLNVGMLVVWIVGMEIVTLILLVMLYNTEYSLKWVRLKHKVDSFKKKITRQEVREGFEV